MSKIWKWIEYNRFLVVAPICATLIWLIAVGCTATVRSPTTPGVQVNAPQLEVEFQIWQKAQEAMLIRFEAAGEDLKRQEEAQAKFLQLVMGLASGGVADLPGLLQLLLGGGLLGAVGDNIRKRGLIAGLKRNGSN